MRRPLLGMVLLLGIMLGCQSQEEKELETALCGCVQTESGKWDMRLTPECMQLCVETFGPELKDMEAWFEEHCGKIEIETKVQPAPEVKI